MPISQEETITKGSRAIKLFTDRLKERRHFLYYLNESPPREKILFFHGDGGNGKSLLLRFLKEQYCRLIPEKVWKKLKTLNSDEEFISGFDVVAVDGFKVPVAYINFDSPNKTEDNPREGWSALLRLRRELGVQGLKFPLFDFAIVLFLHARHELSSERIKSLFPQEEADFASSLIELVTGEDTPGIGITLKVLGLLNKHLKTNLALWRSKRGLSKQLVEEIESLDPKAEIPEYLPKIFAKDLNASLQMPDSPRRVVLFFDTHESFWGTERHIHSIESYYQRDEWLRSLLNELYAPNYGVVTVVAGREPPRWANTKNVSIPIPAEYIDTQFIGHLDRLDAENYLKRAFTPMGTDDSELRNSLIRYAEVKKNQIHPLYLGLATDIVLQAYKKGTTLTASEFVDEADTEAKSLKLANRLLKYSDKDVRYAVGSLAAARSFDWELFHALGEKMHYHATKPAFETLVDFSFIWQDPLELGRYRIHDLLRKILRTLDTEQIIKSHAALEGVYRRLAKNEPNALVEAIYHANQQDWQRGAKEWYRLIEESIDKGHYDFGARLVELQPELLLETFSAQADAANITGEFALSLSHHQSALANLGNAVAIYDKKLEHSPDDVAVYINKGNVHANLADLYQSLANYKDAVHACEKASTAYDKALMRAPDDTRAHMNKGNILSKLGDLHEALAAYQDAEQNYQDAIDTYDIALEHAPDCVSCHMNKGLALMRLGDLHAVLANSKKAMKYYYDAIAAYDKELLGAPDDAHTLRHKGIALTNLGDLYIILSDYQNAVQIYQDAIVTYDALLEFAPNHVHVQINKGLTLISLGDLHASLSGYQDAEQAYKKAITIYDLVLEYATDDVEAHMGKGIALWRLGDLQRTLANYQKARQAYKNSIVAYDQALVFAPSYIKAHVNKGNTLGSLGILHLVLAEHDDAKLAHHHAIAAYDVALEHAHDYTRAHMNKGIILVSLGNLYVSLSDLQNAKHAYQDAIATYDTVLEHAPDDSVTHMNKGIALMSLGELYVSLSNYQDVWLVFKDAIAAYEKALNHSPDNIFVLYNKALCLSIVAELHHSCNQIHKCCEKLKEAKSNLIFVLQVSPNYNDAQFLLEETEKLIVKWCNS